MENKRLVRSRNDYMLGGVCGGLGRYFGIDPTWVRIFFVVFTFAGGSGVLVYLLLWIVIPREDSVQVQGPLTGDQIGDRARQMGDEMRQVAAQPNPKTMQFIGIALLVFGLITLLQNLNIPWLRWLSVDIFWPLVIILAGAFLLYRAFRRN